MGLRVGVIGLGRWGTKALEEWTELKRLGEIDGIEICDQSPTALARGHKNAGVDSAHTNVDALLRNVDAVHICTDNELHHAHAMAAIQAGRHVLVEKPMTLSLGTSEALADAAKDRGVALLPGHIYRYDKCVQRATKVTEAGDPFYARLRWTSRIPAPNKHGVIWDLLPHPVDILNHLWGEWPVEWTGKAWHLDDAAWVNHASLQATYPSGRAASFELSWMDHYRRREFEIVCEHATVRGDLIKQELDAIGHGHHKWDVARNNTIRDEQAAFLEACKDPGKARWMGDVGVGCVRSVAAAVNAVRT
jgi:predicted dehydrogenase